MNIPSTDELLEQHYSEYAKIVANELWCEQYRKTPYNPMPLEVALDLARVIWYNRNRS